MNHTTADICDFMEKLAPVSIAESWDNVGFLLGRRERVLRTVMTCLTVTPQVIDEASAQGVELIITHHPFPFRALKKATDETYEGRMLLQLVEAKIGVYSSHTAFDSARKGINQDLAERINLTDIRAFRPTTLDQTADGVEGGGRFGTFNPTQTIDGLVARLKEVLGCKQITLSRPKKDNDMLRRVGIACGAGSSFLKDAVAAECDVLITGEAGLHAALEAKGCDIALILCGHYYTEYFAMAALASEISRHFPSLRAICSKVDSDPFEQF